MSEDLRAAVAAGVLGAEEAHRSLLQSVVEVARALFRAKASSIFLLDEETDELVFEAVAGGGADTLVGQRFPSSTGVAGWVLVTRQPLVLGRGGRGRRPRARARSGRSHGSQRHSRRRPRSVARRGSGCSRRSSGCCASR